MNQIYRGLPLAGASSWVDSWGAPRFEFGTHYRRHEGQDLLCNRGAPVLAVQAGRVEFDTDPLGGKVARLYLDDGSYFYYAHLGGWNLARFSSGDRVEGGAVIGICGTTGNAAGTPPHLHFGWYSRGIALNPIDLLAARLGHVESRAQRILRSVLSERVSNIGISIAKRRFGDRLIPQARRSYEGRDTATLRLLDLLLPSLPG